MSKLDIILSIPLIWGAFIGFKKGLILELATFIGLLLGIYGSLKFSDITAEWLTSYVEVSKQWLGILSFIVTFLLIVIGVFLLAKTIEKLVKIVALGLVNRLLGLLFGLLKYALILSVLLYLFENVNRKFELVDPSYKENSLLAPSIEKAISPFKELFEKFEIEKIPEVVKLNP